MSHNHPKQSTGFTLLEIMIALFIFAIVSMILVSALHNILNEQSDVEKKAARLAQLQITLLLLSRDIEQTIDRPITNAAGKTEDFLGAPHAITFTHAGLANPFGTIHRATLQRTRYQIENHHLIRMTWPVLDQTTKTVSDSRNLLNHLDDTDLTFEYLDSKGTFQTTWPPRDKQEAKLPRAVRVSINIPNWGNITQLYLITGQSLEQADSKSKQHS